MIVIWNSSFGARRVGRAPIFATCGVSASVPVRELLRRCSEIDLSNATHQETSGQHSLEIGIDDVGRALVVLLQQTHGFLGASFENRLQNLGMLGADLADRIGL